MKRSTQAILGIVAAGGAALTGIFGYVLFQGPRMKVQPHLRAYQASMPLPPAGSVATRPSPYVPAETTARTPYPTGPGGAARGAAYYASYCLFCHGEQGKGDGPVGQGYTPAPADLTSGRIAAYDPARLHRAMLTGTGHAPVLERVVRPEYRWDLVAFVTSMGRAKERR